MKFTALVAAALASSLVSCGGDAGTASVPTAGSSSSDSAAKPVETRPTIISIVGTSDLHGHIWGDAHLAGPLNRVGLAGRVMLDDIHGWNFIGGKDGQNVRLAYKLTQYRIEIEGEGAPVVKDEPKAEVIEAKEEAEAEEPAEEETASIAPAPEFSAADLEQPGSEWLTNGGSLTNDRFSPLSEIDTSNVKELKGDWMAKIGKSGPALPVKIRVVTDYGTLFMQLSDYQTAAAPPGKSKP